MANSNHPHNKLAAHLRHLPTPQLNGSHALRPHAARPSRGGRLPTLLLFAEESPPPPPSRLSQGRRPGGGGSAAGGGAAARRWTVRAQAQPPSQPEAEDANPKGRQGGWHRTRGAAVGAAVVLACALGAACLNRRGGAYCCTQGSAEAPLTQTAAGDYTSLTVAQRSVSVLSGIFKQRAAERSMLLQHVIDEIKNEAVVLGLQPERVRFLVLMAEHLYDGLLREDYCRFAALRAEYATTDALFAEWFRLSDPVRKYDLGLLLIEIFIKKRDYQKALAICNRISEPKLAPDSDPRPNLYLAIIKMMLAVESMLEPTTKLDEEERTKKLDELTKEARDEWKTWNKKYQNFGSEPPI